LEVLSCLGRRAAGFDAPAPGPARDPKLWGSGRIMYDNVDDDEEEEDDNYIIFL
jgi:hypothetical protein